MYVAQSQALRACMQSQNLCLTDSLVLGRQNTHCLEMNADAIRVLHSLTATTLCQMDQINTAYLLERRRSHTWDQKKSIITMYIPLSFTTRTGGPRIPTSNNFSTTLSSIINKLASISPPPLIRILTKSDNLIIEKCDIFPIFFFVRFGAVSGMYCNFVKNILHITNRPQPSPKAPRMHAQCPPWSKVPGLEDSHGNVEDNGV